MSYWKAKKLVKIRIFMSYMKPIIILAFIILLILALVLYL